MMPKPTGSGADDPSLIPDSEEDALIAVLTAHVTDKWTVLILDALLGDGELRFTRLARRVPSISQKMLTQTLRSMERDDLVVRTVHAVVPPKVEYRLTDSDIRLATAFLGIWTWAGRSLSQVREARRAFDVHHTAK